MIISIIEMNKGSFHILISLLFIFKKKNISTINEGLKNITGMIKNFVGNIGNKIKNFLFFGKTKKVEKTNSQVKNIEDNEKEII